MRRAVIFRFLKGYLVREGGEGTDYDPCESVSVNFEG